MDGARAGGRRHPASRLAALAVTLAGAAPAPAATFAFLHGVPGDYVGGGVDRRLDGAFTASADVGHVRVDASGSGHTASFDFAAPDGQALAPGAYENAAAMPSAGVPGLSVVVDGRGCAGITGRFTVLDAAYDGGGALVSFGASFEQHCDGGPALTGLLRYHAGDAACATNGAPCDDGDACTQSSACQGGVCAGTDPAACPGAEACRTGPSCDPLTGGCLAGTPKPDGLACAEPETCAAAGTCRAGVCEATPLGNCWDGNACTDDVCVPGPQCEHPRIAGSCWTLEGTTTFTATVRGATCSCSQRFRGVLALRDDGRFAMPGGVANCPNGAQVVVPDEVGTWTREGGRLALRTTNLAELTSANGACASAPLRVKGYRTTLKVLRHGNRLRGRHVERDHVVGQPITLGVSARFRGVPGSGLPKAKKPKASCGRILSNCLLDKLS
ncbi:MAG TPA: hypothetical protein VFD84_16935 [Candidatus Binatia bacterium]|jgi:hypothetical protein|nr:hypothetical protein [Candidatus Binatia bacterium]